MMMILIKDTRMVTFSSHIFQSFSISTPTVAECRAQCEIQKSCRLFTFDSVNANCRSYVNIDYDVVFAPYLDDDWAVAAAADVATADVACCAILKLVSSVWRQIRPG